jgi:hypothetical protein
MKSEVMLWLDGMMMMMMMMKSEVMDQLAAH